MEKIIDFLRGKKTYILSLVAIGFGIKFQSIELIMTALISMGIRDAIK